MLIAVIGILISATGFSVYFLSQHPAKPSVPSSTTADPVQNLSTGVQNLSGDQKKLVEAIALKQISADSYLGWREDSVSNVSIGSVHEVVPGIDRVVQLPYAEVAIGNSSHSGANALLYVDLAKKRVVYVGYVTRSVEGDIRHFYLSRPDMDGVMGNDLISSGDSPRYSQVSYYNDTYYDTPYQAGLSLSQEADLEKTAKSNETVKRFLNGILDKGENYTMRFDLQWEWGFTGGHRYRYAYPVVYFVSQNADYAKGYEDLKVSFSGFDGGITSVYLFQNGPWI